MNIIKNRAINLYGMFAKRPTMKCRALPNCAVNRREIKGVSIDTLKRKLF